MLQIDFQFTTQPLRASRGAYHTLTYTKSNNQVTLATFSSLHIESLLGHGKSLKTRREIVEKVSFDALSLERYFFLNSDIICDQSQERWGFLHYWLLPSDQWMQSYELFQNFPTFIPLLHFHKICLVKFFCLVTVKKFSGRCKISRKSLGCHGKYYTSSVPLFWRFKPRKVVFEPLQAKYSCL